MGSGLTTDSGDVGRGLGVTDTDGIRLARDTSIIDVDIATAGGEMRTGESA